MQAATQQTPAPQAPAAPLPAPPTITTVGPDGVTQTITVPATKEEAANLLSQRQELSEQLISATSRRRELSEEISLAPAGASRTGLEERVRVLDQRIIQLESDIASTGRQLAATPKQLISEAGQEGYPSGGGDDFEEGFFAGGFTALGFVLVYTLFRRWRRRRKGPAPAKTVVTESSGRLERLEQGMEAIAIEIERVSEGQRFVTRLLSEAHDRTPAARPQRELAPIESDAGSKGAL